MRAGHAAKGTADAEKAISRAYAAEILRQKIKNYNDSRTAANMLQCKYQKLFFGVFFYFDPLLIPFRYHYIIKMMLFQVFVFDCSPTHRSPAESAEIPYHHRDFADILIILYLQIGTHHLAPPPVNRAGEVKNAHFFVLHIKHQKISKIILIFVNSLLFSKRRPSLFSTHG